MVKVSDLKTANQVKDELAQANPEVRRELERTALANDVAIRVIRYRTEHGLSQTQLARQLGLHQSAIARLEGGDHEPSLPTLGRLAKGLGMEFHIDVAPDGGVRLQPTEPGTPALRLESSRIPGVSPELTRLMAPHLAEIKARVTVAAAAHPGKVLNGGQIFPDVPAYSQRWDALAARNWSVLELIFALAVIRAVTEESHEEQEQQERVAS